MSGAQLRAYARDDGKVICEIWDGDRRQASWEMAAAEAERTGRGLIEKANAARQFTNPGGSDG